MRRFREVEEEDRDGPLSVFLVRRGGGAVLDSGLHGGRGAGDPRLAEGPPGGAWCWPASDRPAARRGGSVVAGLRDADPVELVSAGDHGAPVARDRRRVDRAGRPRAARWRRTAGNPLAAHRPDGACRDGNGRDLRHPPDPRQRRRCPGSLPAARGRKPHAVEPAADRGRRRERRAPAPAGRCGDRGRQGVSRRGFADRSGRRRDARGGHGVSRPSCGDAGSHEAGRRPRYLPVHPRLGPAVDRHDPRGDSDAPE